MRTSHELEGLGDKLLTIFFSHGESSREWVPRRANCAVNCDQMELG